MAGELITSHADNQVLPIAYHTGPLRAGVFSSHAYLATHPNRFRYVLTHGSWLNIVETMIGKMARTFLKHIRVKFYSESPDVKPILDQIRNDDHLHEIFRIVRKAKTAAEVKQPSPIAENYCTS